MAVLREVIRVPRFGVHQPRPLAILAAMSEAPAGWYPQADGRQRYWDGGAWTEHFHAAEVRPEPPRQVQQPQGNGPLLSFTSHIAGKNAKVRVYPDRIEWQRSGSALSLGRGRGSEMIPMRQVTSVATRKDGMRTVVSIITSGNTIDMRVGRGEANQIKPCLG